MKIGMEDLENIALLMDVFPIIITLIIWDGIWKLMGLWKSAQNRHLAWFITIAILNTGGILPIIYLIIYRKKSNDQAIEVR